MKFDGFLAVLVVAGTILGAQGVAASEIKVLSVGPLRTLFDELGPHFERTTGHTLLIKYGVSAALKRAIDAGEAFDVAIILPNQIEDLLKQGKVAIGTRVDVARGPLGVAVKAGAAKPDINSTDAFRRTLLSAKSIAYSAEGGSGIYFLNLIERLGITSAVKPKLHPTGGGAAVVVPVAKGEVEIAVVSISNILAEPGVELVGPLPPDLQFYVIYTAGVAAAAKDQAGAKALIKFLTAPAAVSILKSKGLEPVTP